MAILPVDPIIAEAATLAILFKVLPTDPLYTCSGGWEDITLYNYCRSYSVVTPFIFGAKGLKAYVGTYSQVSMVSIWNLSVDEHP